MSAAGEGSTEPIFYFHSLKGNENVNESVLSSSTESPLFCPEMRIRHSEVNPASPSIHSSKFAMSRPQASESIRYFTRT